MDGSKHRKIRKPPKLTTIQQKKEIIQYHDDNPGLYHYQIAEKFGLDSSTASKIIKNRDQILALKGEEMDQIVKFKSTHFPYLEEEVYKWCLSEKIKKRRLTIDKIAVRAIEVKEVMIKLIKEPRESKKLKRFEASLGWVQSFKRRYDIDSESTIPPTPEAQYCSPFKLQFIVE